MIPKDYISPPSGKITVPCSTYNWTNDYVYWCDTCGQAFDDRIHPPCGADMRETGVND